MAKSFQEIFKVQGASCRGAQCAPAGGYGIRPYEPQGKFVPHRRRGAFYMLPCSFILSRLWRAHNVRPYKQWCCSSVGADAGIGPQCRHITHHRGRAETALPLSLVDRYFGFRSQASRFNVDAIARLSPPPAPAGAPSQRGPFFQASSRF